MEQEKIKTRETKAIRKIVMSVNREILTFLIVDKTVMYTDRKFRMLIRILPKPKNFIQAIDNSRNRIPRTLIELFKFTKEEMAEYNNAKDTNALAEIIIRDGKKNGCILVANGDIEADKDLVNKIKELEVIA